MPAVSFRRAAAIFVIVVVLVLANVVGENDSSWEGIVAAGFGGVLGYATVAKAAASRRRGALGEWGRAPSDSSTGQRAAR